MSWYFYAQLEIVATLTADLMSSRVAEKLAMRSVGMLEMNPTVSVYITVILDGRVPICVETSKVANRRSSGISDGSCVIALIKDVLPKIK